MLNGYWRRHPPAHVLLAAQVGYKAPEEDRASERVPHDANELGLLIQTLSQIPGGVIDLKGSHGKR